ncbi:YcnI family protein [Dactylosporangium sp. NPDC051541]|uniref:YcnI family protein n=1 Tax=Dactylosporangium sp. NPDC051541 TaxID=3363977 RepID=UPI0037B91645
MRLRLGTILIAAAAGAFAFPVAASAHVTVNPGTATQGGYTKVTFRVPNERDGASTTKVEVAIPTDKPIASVALRPVPGWTAVTDSTKLATPVKTDDGELTEAISKITWTAGPGAEIKPHQFQEFDVSLGPLPDTDQLVFKALQTYSNGEVVRWIDEPAADHPAPVLKLTKAGTTTARTTSTGTAAQDANAVMNNGKAGVDGTALTLGIAGLVLGFAGLVAGLLAYRRAGQRTPATAASGPPRQSTPASL